MGQYFLGYSSYQLKHSFDPSLFVTIRKRLSARQIEAINKVFVLKVKELRKIDKETKQARKRNKPPKVSDGNAIKTDTSEPLNKGKLIVDATVAPSNIKYPTDLDLLNDAREISNQLIDKMYLTGQFDQKPRTYRQLARQDYLNIIKKKRKGKKTLRKGIRKQIQYMRRNLSHIDKILEALKDHPHGGLRPQALNQREQELLDIIRKIYSQQGELYAKKRHSVKDRIVSIHQPYIRPTVRGKANAHVEFGAKISLSVVDGFVFLDRLKWDAFLTGDSCWSNENQDLSDQVNEYKQRLGHYPAVVIADGIYGTRENRQYLKEKGIRFFPQGIPGGAGKKLGRPPKEIYAITREMELLRILEQGERNEVEGKIVTAKTRYGLGKVMTRTQETSENWISIAIFSMNMANGLRLTAKLVGRFLLSLLDSVKKTVKYHVQLVPDR